MVSSQILMSVIMEVMNILTDYFMYGCQLSEKVTGLRILPLKRTLLSIYVTIFNTSLMDFAFMRGHIWTHSGHNFRLSHTPHID